jgi:DNA polymerase V
MTKVTEIYKADGATKHQSRFPFLDVDRSLEPKDKRIVVAVVNGEFTVKRVSKKAEQVSLLAEDPKYPAIEIKDGMDFEVWGVVVYVVHSV